MSKKSVFVIAKSVCEDAELSQAIESQCPGVQWYFADSDRCRNLEYLSGHSKNMTGLLVGHQDVSAAFLGLFPELKVLSKYGVGVDNIDFEACQKHSVSALYTPGVNKQYVAEHCLGLLISMLRRISVSDRSVRLGKWERNGGESLIGKTVGIIGFGNIGTSLARLLNVFDCQVLAYDIVNKDEDASRLKVKLVSLDELLKSSDIVTMHVPLTAITTSMCDASFFQKMKKGAYYMNAARGKILDPAALEKCLVSGHLAAASCDVFPDEPILNFGLSKLENFISTPHIAANCKESKYAMALSAAKLLEDYLGQ